MLAISGLIKCFNMLKLRESLKYRCFC